MTIVDSDSPALPGRALSPCGPDSMGPVNPPSYDPRFFPELAEVEDQHFWFRTRNQVIARLVEQVTDRWPDSYRVLEVGCGTGNVLRALEKACPRGQVFGMDLFAEGLAFARTRTSRPLVQADVGQAPFGAQFDLIGAFDVIEHLADDVNVLRSLHRMLKPHGLLFLTVPASRSLWSYFDEVSHHRRRYEPDELRRKLSDTGYRVEFCSPFMAATYPLFWCKRRMRLSRGNTSSEFPEKKRARTAKELRIIPGVNGLLRFLLTQETRFLKSRVELPFGSSLVAVAARAA